jgi:hypothetical protein
VYETSLIGYSVGSSGSHTISEAKEIWPIDINPAAISPRAARSIVRRFFITSETIAQLHQLSREFLTSSLFLRCEREEQLQRL